MPRQTRAAQRAKEEVPDIHDDEVARHEEQADANDENAPVEAVDQPRETAKISLTVKSTSGRPPLQEVAANVGEQIAELQRQFPPEKIAGTGKGKSGSKGTTKGKKAGKAEESEQGQDPEVVEDENVAPPSPASDEAARDLSGGVDIPNDVVLLDESETPASAAAHATRRQISPSDRTRQTHKKSAGSAARSRSRKGVENGTANTKKTIAKDEGKKQPINSIPANPSSVPETLKKQHDSDDISAKEKNRRAEAVHKLESVFDKPQQVSGVQAPLSGIMETKPSPRTETPEDPIEAMDALEDAIEEIGKELPALDKPTAPPKKPATKKASKEQDVKKSAATKPKASPAPVSSKTAPRKSSAPVGPRETKASTLRKNGGQVPAKKPLGTITNRPVSPKQITAKVEARKSSIAALSTPPPPAKSTKPPTRPTFALPGEAITAKLKAQKEERQKKQEEEAAKKRKFTAKPVPKAKPVEVRATTTSRARMSMMIDPTDVNTDGEAWKSATIGPLKRTSSVASADLRTKRLSTTTLAHRPKSAIFPPGALKSPPISANTSRRPRPSSTIVTKPVTAHARNTANTARARTPSGPKPTGKDIFNRDRVERDTQQMSAKEKQEAAKQARAAAAERGRQASREWAEKMKAKKMGVKSTTTPITQAVEAKNDGETGPGTHVGTSVPVETTA